MATLITGCNRGIGLELAKQSKQRGEKIIAVCRTYSDEIRLIADQVIDGVDITDRASLQKAVLQIREPLQKVIQNAGLFLDDSIDDLQRDSLQKQFFINALAPLEFTSLLLPKISDGAKLAFITSRMGSIADNTTGGYYGYRMSKAALNAGVKSLAIDLKPRNIATIVLHPGYVKTRMTGFQGDRSPEEAARGLLQRIDALHTNITGTFWHMNGELLPW
jgi:NAD(P)-dependent dehydrogenase (short-subunit alcohol dehydrogenase family)